MELLLDTHTFLWFVGGDPQLSSRARHLIQDPANTRYLSIATAWELAIKASVRKLDLKAPFPVFWEQVARNGMGVPPIAIAHLSIIAELPLHHRDPLDRLLIAQALAERLPLISADPRFDAYPVARLW